MSKNTVGSLAELVGGQVQGDPALEITGVNDLRLAKSGEICFVRDQKYIELARKSGAGALLVHETLDVEAVQVVVKDVHAAFAKIALHFHPVPRAEEHFIHPSAEIDPAAVIDQPVQIGAMAVIEANVQIGAGTVIRSGCVLAEGSRLGTDCLLYPRVVLYAGVQLGNRVVVHAGSVIGSDGFGYASDEGRWLKLPQLGSVLIEDDVEIGANTTIDRATLGLTRIGPRSKLDNLIHVGHNCDFGADNAVAGFSAFSGSTIMGNRVNCAGHTVSAGHLKVADDVRIGGNSVIYGDVEEPGDYIGYPLQKKSRWGRTLHILNRLVEMQEKLRGLVRDKEESGKGKSE